MSAENEFLRQNKAARAAPVHRNGVPNQSMRKCSPQQGGVYNSVEGVRDVATL